VAAGVVRVRSISTIAEDSKARSVDVGVEALDAVTATASVSAARSNTGEVTYSGAKPLAIGVELYDLRFDEQAGKLVMGSEETAVTLRRGRPAPLSPAFPTDEDEALLELESVDA
jgi:hypothetical protein